MPSTAEYYHEQTKYTPEGLRRGGPGLDFSKQPVPFKAYATGDLIDLKRHLPPGGEIQDDERLLAWRLGLHPHERALAELSIMLYLTNGVTAMVPQPGQPFYMRAAPSAGGLYPTEIYLAARGHAGLADGLYNYQVRDHSLVRFWGHDVWARLKAACFDHPAFDRANLLVLFTGVFERSAWRYGDRAYRRVLLDTGHVLGNLALVAPYVDRHVHPIGGYADEAIDAMLFLNEEEEGAIALAALLPWDARAIGPTALAGPVGTAREVPEGQRLAAVHAAGKLPEGGPAHEPPAWETEAPKLPFGFGQPLEAEPIVWAGTLGPTILARRSTREYSGEGLTQRELATLLGFTYHPESSQEARVERHPEYFAPELLETYVAIHDVAGLDPGCYHYDRARQTLRQIRFKDLRREVQYLALGQDLAGLAAAVVFHTVDLPRAVARYGDRAYRYSHLDAGHLGERLNVAAIKLGLGVSGIGGFFDDQVNDLLGIPADQAVLYLTTIGRPAGE